MHSDPAADPPRYPMPDGLREKAAGLAKWMQIVGILQTCCAGLAFALFSCSAVAIVSSDAHWSLVLITAILLAMLGILVRQGLLLQSAADHLKGLGDEPDDAHDHLQLAFARLRPMFAIDVAVGVLLVLRNGLGLWGMS
jgi:hypothetical protein